MLALVLYCKCSNLLNGIQYTEIRNHMKSECLSLLTLDFDFQYTCKLGLT